jgi:hypothetical protein
MQNNYSFVHSAFLEITLCMKNVQLLRVPITEKIAGQVVDMFDYKGQCL